LVRTHEEHPVVVHNADAKPVKPTGAAKKVSAESRILGEKYNGRELNAKRLNCYLVLVRGERSSHSAKTLKPAGLNVQPKHLSVLVFEDAMRGASTQFRQEFHRLSADGKRDRYLDAVLSFCVLVCSVEFEGNPHPHQPGTNGSDP
jgi:hypothetical protein